MTTKSTEIKQMDATNYNELFCDLPESVSAMLEEDAPESQDENNSSDRRKPSRAKAKETGKAKKNSSENKGSFVHYTIDIPEEFHTRMREYAFIQNDSIHNLVITAVDKYLKKLNI